MGLLCFFCTFTKSFVSLKLKIVVNGLVGRILLKFWWKWIKSVSIKFFIVCILQAGLFIL